MDSSDVCHKIGIEFVDYVRVSTEIESLNAERDKPSTQAKRNGIKEDKKREGVILRPLIEFTLNNGKRVIAKHKGDDFKETKTKREISPEKPEVLTKANEIAEEWVTEMRLEHVLDKFPQNTGIEKTKEVIRAMTEDIYREAEGEIVGGKEVDKAIGKKTAQLFKKRLQKQLENQD